MIAVARKNLFCLFLNPNSILCPSNVHLFSPIHFFSTPRVRELIPNPEIYHVLFHKHHLSPELASLAASHLHKFRSPERADSILSFLKENNLTTTQLEKIVIYDPRILWFTIEGFESRFKLFRDLGLSAEEIAKIMVQNTAILHSSVANRIVPALSVLKALLGSNQDVARLLKRCTWFVTADLEKILLPNVEILKSCGLPTERVLHYLYTSPRCFLVKPDIMRKSVDKAIDIGVPRTSVTFVQALTVLSYMSEGMWEVKLETFRDFGFSDNDIFTIFKNHPIVFSSSGKKMKNKIELLLATGKYDISSILTCPVSLGCSIEKRIEPRLQILRFLESRNLIRKWPRLSAVARLTDARFFDRFIRPYHGEIGEEHIIKIYVEGRKR